MKGSSFFYQVGDDNAAGAVVGDGLIGVVELVSRD